MPLDLSAWLIVVPARLASERLPRKPLVDLGGVPLVVRVFRNLTPLLEAGAAGVVATDSHDVLKACEQHGVPARMTKESHQSGTDRCAEAAEDYRHRYVLNVQGDEPFVSTSDLKALMSAMMQRPEADMGTLAFHSEDQELAADPNAVKAIRTNTGWALYFSRASLPYVRDAKSHLPSRFWHHLGIYAFRRERLLDFVTLGQGELEKLEKLEQLRALENGWRLYIEPAQRFARGIDTPEDLEAARARI